MEETPENTPCSTFPAQIPIIPQAVPETLPGWFKSGYFIATGSTQRFYFERPDEFEFSLSDIARSLSNLCRYTGHFGWWSVGQHCLLVSNMLEPKYKLRGLLHDATEAFVADVPGPLKLMPGMEWYNQLEKRIAAAIHRQFRVPVEDTKADEAVRYADRWALRAEADMLGLRLDDVFYDYPEYRIPPMLLRLTNDQTALEYERRAVWLMEQ